MDSLIARALDTAAARGASYADARLVETAQERYSVRTGVVDVISNDESVGIGVRVVVDGAWGFASTNYMTAESIDQTAALAVEIARASATSGGPKVGLGPPVSSRGAYATPVEIDPFSISPEDKLALLLDADQRMARVEGISARTGNLIFIRERKSFANSEGADLEQTIYEAGGGIQATAVGNGEVQRRSYPQSMGRQQGCSGWEYVRDFDLAGSAERVASEAVELLTADRCPSDITTTLIIGGSQVGLQIHESCGHAIELDRVLGSEAAYAGTSFLTTDKLHDFRYGSEQVNITADSIRLPGLGSFGWDDEGVPAQSTPIVEAGRFVGYLMSRETAATLGLQSNGTMRASSWNRLPLIRMTNVSLEPGDWDPGGPHRRHRTTASSWRPTAPGPSTTGATTSSSAPRWATRSRTASWAGCCATAPTPASRLSSGTPATPCATPTTGPCGARPTAARASRASWDTRDTARRLPASATCEWE